jgi:hypothetical protein
MGISGAEEVIFIKYSWDGNAGGSPLPRSEKQSKR